MNPILTDTDLLLPLFQKLSKDSRMEFWREACLLYSDEIWATMKEMGTIDFGIFKRWGDKIPP